jgi:hypothetical protein
MANTVGSEDGIVANSALILAAFQQNWENVRHIKSERMWFMNTNAVITAGVLSLLQNIRGEFVLQLSLIFCMCILSLIALVTSLRLKAELEECLEKIQTMITREQLNDIVALGRLEGHRSPPAFRWIFPVIYSIVTAFFVALFFYQLALGSRT